MDNLLEPKTVAELLDVTTDDLKNWRRLADDHPGRLASVRIDGRHYYDPVVVVDFLERNPKRLAVAQFAREEQRALLPRAVAVRTVSELRGTSAPSPEPEQPASEASTPAASSFAAAWDGWEGWADDHNTTQSSASAWEGWFGQPAPSHDHHNKGDAQQ